MKRICKFCKKETDFPNRRGFKHHKFACFSKIRHEEARKLREYDRQDREIENFWRNYEG